MALIAELSVQHRMLYTYSRWHLYAVQYTKGRWHLATNGSRCFDHACTLNTWKTVVTDTDRIRISICKNVRIRIVHCGYGSDTDSKNCYLHTSATKWHSELGRHTPVNSDLHSWSVIWDRSGNCAKYIIFATPLVIIPPYEICKHSNTVMTI